MEESLLSNVYFWSGTALALFLGVAIWKGRKPMVSWLDSEILRVGQEIEQAKALRGEAEAALASSKAKQAEALAEARAILDQARRAAETIRTNAESDLAQALVRREKQAMDRIAAAEADALNSVRATVVDLAIKASALLIQEQLDASQAARLMDQAIAEIPERLGSPAVPRAA